MRKSLKILVTGVGGMIGIGIVKALRQEFGKNIKIVGTDSSSLAPSFYLSNFLDDFYLLPLADNRNYIPEIFRIADSKKVNLIFPGTDHETLPLAKEISNFEKRRIRIIVSPPEVVEICNDKWLSYKKLKDTLSIAETYLAGEKIDSKIRSIGLPVVIKPRFGWGSRSVYKADSIAEVKIFLKKVQQPIIQKWVDPPEYTIDGLISQQGKLICVVPRKRISLLAGLSSQGITLKDKKLMKLAQKLANSLRIRGPFNFQARRKHGRYFILDINPRFAGTGILSVAAGANVPALAVKDILGYKIPRKVTFKEDVVITRYIEDVFISKKDIAK